MLLKALLGVSVFYLFLFLAAGRLNYLYGWIYYTISILGLLLNIWIIRDKPDLMEDKTLNSELPGYAEYARTTRYRLVPGLW